MQQPIPSSQDLIKEFISIFMSMFSSFGMLVVGAPVVNRSHIQLAASAPLSFHPMGLSYNLSKSHHLTPTSQSKTRPVLVYSTSPHQQDVVVGKEERVDEDLVHVIREELISLEEETRTTGSIQPLTDCLTLVDWIQRLGIQRYFQQHINTVLKTTYMKWSDEYGLGDVDVTVLAFRLLRLQGYLVSADVLKRLKDGKINFSCFSIENPNKISGMLNLFKCSQTSFPFESNVMGEAMEFASSQLNNALERDPSVLQTDNLRFEVKFALDYPRKYLLPRLESRSIIQHLRPSNWCKRKCLDLAKQDLIILQKHHKEEMHKIERWWEEKEVKDLPFFRGQIHKFFFSISTSIFEQQFSACRTAFTKSTCVSVLLDDLFDSPTSDFDGISRFVEAVQRWDPSPLTNLHEHKAMFSCFQNTLNDIATEASKGQGRDLLPFYRSLWEDMVLKFFKEVEWKHNHCIPTLEEYLENGAFSITATPLLLSSIFLMGEPITDEAIRHVGRGSRFLYLVGLVSRLANDIATFRREAMAGETNSAVSCYMQENPWCTEEEAILVLRGMVEAACVELEFELFSCHGVVPECCTRVIMGFARVMCLIYKRSDAYTEVLDSEFEGLCNDYLYGSLD